MIRPFALGPPPTRSDDDEVDSRSVETVANLRGFHRDGLSTFQNPRFRSRATGVRGPSLPPKTRGMKSGELPENWTRLPLDDAPLATGVIDLVLGPADRVRNSMLVLPCDEYCVGCPRRSWSVRPTGRNRTPNAVAD